MKLLSCPFCGNVPTKNHWGITQITYSIRCDNCGCEMMGDVECDLSNRWNARICNKLLIEINEILNEVTTEGREDPNSQWQEKIDELGFTMGYGALMCGALASWKKYSIKHNLPKGGEFAVGPCIGVLKCLKNKIQSMLEK